MNAKPLHLEILDNNREVRVTRRRAKRAALASALAGVLFAVGLLALAAALLDAAATSTVATAQRAPITLAAAEGW